MSKIPATPAFLSMPIASSGDARPIEEITSTPGRLSLEKGLPIETQRPLAEGGIAPNRLDFNASLKLLSGYAFWNQSGGMFTHSPLVNYPTPAVIFHDGKLWFCTKLNGPDSPDGIKIPGADGSEDHWQDFLRYAAGGGAGSVLGVPVGTVITYAGTTIPAGFFACNGQSFSVSDYPKLYTLLGKAHVPDMRGLFVRGYDPDAVRDPDGITRQIGTEQNDAIRNMTGTISGTGAVEEGARYTGVLYNTGEFPGGGHGKYRDWGIGFDASRQVPTAPENRPKNINLLYCIKHD